MNVSYSAAARQSGKDFLLLEQATTTLKEVITEFAEHVKIEWDRTEDATGSALFTLHLSDDTGAVAADFTPDELQAPRHVRIRLHQLWGDLLRIKSHRLLEAMGRE